MQNDTFELKNLKGTFDFLPSEQKLRNHITDTLKNVFEVYSYQPIETPILCHYDVLASKYAGGAEILKEVYKLKDQGNRELALRYDLTVPVARFVAMNPNLTLPFKRYEIGKVYRDGPVKLGRNREFYQCDVDAIGVKSVMIEAELMSLAFDAFKKLNIDIFMSYNNRKLMSGLIEIVGVNQDSVKDVITIIDKIKKISKAEFIAELEKLKLTSTQIEQLYGYFSFTLPQIEEEFKNTTNENILVGISELNELQTYLNELNILQDCKLDLSLARGHEIYTGTVFEAFTKDGKITSSIAGGGRYDNIITQFINNGTEYPACGISFGFDVIYTYLNTMLNQNMSDFVDLYIIPMNTNSQSLNLARNLRALNVKVELAFNNRPVSKEMKRANKLEMPFVLVLGESELETKQLQLKNMRNSETKTFSLNNLPELANEILTTNLQK